MLNAPEIISPVRVVAVLLYDVLESGCAGKRLLDRLTIRSAGELQFVLRPWRFDILSTWRPLAFGAHPGSELVMVALQPGREIPSLVTRWLQTWAHAHRDAPDTAVLILLQQARTEHDVVVRQNAGQLREVAAQAGLDFLAELPSEWGSRVPPVAAGPPDGEWLISPALPAFLPSTPPTH